MKYSSYVGACALLLLAISGCVQDTSPGLSRAPAEILDSTAWFDNYNAGNAKGVAALYAGDATLMAPDVPAVKGRDAIADFVAADIAGSKDAGITFVRAPLVGGSASGDVAWISGGFSLEDEDAATLATGKYTTVYERRDGEWLIVRDIWNLDAPASTGHDAQVSAMNTLIDAWNSQDPDAMDAIAAPGFTRIAPDQNAASLEELKAFMRQVYAAYPDYAISNDGAAAGPGGAFVMWTVTGTYMPESEESATGKPIKATGISSYEFEDGKIISERVVFDSAAVMRQLETTAMPHATN